MRIVDSEAFLPSLSKVKAAKRQIQHTLGHWLSGKTPHGVKVQKTNKGLFVDTSIQHSHVRYV